MHVATITLNLCNDHDRDYLIPAGDSHKLGTGMCQTEGNRIEDRDYYF